MSDKNDTTANNSMRLIVVGGTAALAAVIAVVLLAGPHLLTLAQGMSGASGHLTNSMDRADEREHYQGPTSAFMIEGLDLEELSFDFADETFNIRDESAPRMLSDSQLQRVIAQNQGELISCYAEQLRDDPDLEGTVDFEFAITPSGHVAMVKVSGSTLRSTAAEDCFVERAKEWQFPQTNQELLTRFETDVTFAF